MKAAIVVLLAAMALPASAQLAMLHNRAAMTSMCNGYANMAEHAVIARDSGMPYADAKAMNERALRIGAASSKTSTQQEKAFMFQYLSGAIDYAYLTMPGTSPQQVHDGALNQCMGQFGL